mmetsp:Transcript_81684/g.252125  ORF Transcript_81684/g.252125 Transcript_81684/m.252125 type:complete len:345 (+) Transcript_81684:747-1781(+)
MDDVSGLERLAVRLVGAGGDLLPRPAKAKAQAVAAQIASNAPGCHPAHANETLEHVDREGSHLAVAHGQVQPRPGPLRRRAALSARTVRAEGHRPLATVLVEDPERACPALRRRRPGGPPLPVEGPPLQVPEGVLEALQVPLEEPQEVFLGPPKLELRDLTEELTPPRDLVDLQLLQGLALHRALLQRRDLPELLLKLQLLLVLPVRRPPSVTPAGVEEVPLVERQVHAEGLAVQAALDAGEALAQALEVALEAPPHGPQGAPGDSLPLLLLQAAAGHGEGHTVAQRGAAPALLVVAHHHLGVLRGQRGVRLTLLLAPHDAALVVVNHRACAREVVGTSAGAEI